MSGFRIRLLGPVSIDVDGAPLVVDTRKAVALLALLAVAVEPQPRRLLAATLWPETDDEHAGGALRRTLSVLRCALDGRWVESRGALVGLGGPALDSDLERERAAWRDLAEHGTAHGEHSSAGGDAVDCGACTRSLASIVALHRGPFMAGFSLRDSVEFDEWQAAAALAAERRLATALRRLARAQARGGNYPEAVAMAERWLALDPLNEDAHRELIGLHAAAGDRSGAIRRYRECVLVLDRELSVEPLPETTDLYRRILAGEPPAAPRPAPRRAPTVDAGGDRRLSPVALPLVGREAELGRLLAAWRAVAAGGGRFAFLEGEPGIGRTRLAEELRVAVEAAEGRAVSVACFPEDRAVPYAATLEVLRALAASAPARLEALPDDLRVELARLTRELGRGPARPQRVAGRLASPDRAAAVGIDERTAASDSISRARFLEALVAAILALAAPEPGAPASLVVIDDAQWIDPASEQVLSRLRRRISATPVLVLLSRRDNELASGRLELAAHAGAAGNGGRSKGGAEVVVRLPRLRVDDVRELVAHLGLPGGRADALFAASDGLPFYLAEYLAASSMPGSGGDGSQVGGPSVAADDASSSIGLTAAATNGLRGPSLPEAIRTLLEARFRALSEPARQVLGAAAVIGRSFDPDLVREVSGRSTDETVAAVEELVAAGLIRERHALDDPAPAAIVDRAAYAFDHPGTAEAAYEGLGLARRRLLHARAAEALRRSGDQGRAAATTIARHYAASGRDDEAARFLTDAAADAERVFANREALELYRSAIALRPSLRPALLERTAHLATMIGDYDEAIRDLETAIATQSASDATAAQSASPAAGRDQPAGTAARLERALASVHARRGEWTLAEHHLTAVLDLLPRGDSVERGRVLVDQAIVARWRGNLARATELASEGLTIAERSGERPLLADAHNVAGMLAKHAGRRAEARRHLALALDLATASGALPARVAALNNLALLEAEEGALGPAMELGEAALRSAIQVGDRQREAALHSNLADVLHAAGRLDEARRHVGQTAAILAEIGVSAALNPEVWRLVEW